MPDGLALHVEVRGLDVTEAFVPPDDFAARGWRLSSIKSIGPSVCETRLFGRWRSRTVVNRAVSMHIILRRDAVPAGPPAETFSIPIQIIEKGGEVWNARVSLDLTQMRADSKPLVAWEFLQRAERRSTAWLNFPTLGEVDDQPGKPH